jgi:hypothetical protein
VADDLIQGGETAYYRALIQQYDKAAAAWIRRGKRIVDRYTDKRSDGQVNKLKYNILWSNIENLKPAIYAQTPKPEVERRFLDKDPIGRVAADALERVISYYLHVTPFGSVMRQTRNDYLLVGRGVPWVRYVPTFKKAGLAGSGQITEDMQAGDDEPLEVVDYEDVLADYVHWKDFGHNVARTWEEVHVVWRWVFLTREQMKNRGFEDWNEIPLDHCDKELKDLPGDDGKKASVCEIWDKNTRKAYWIAKAYPKFLDVRDDPLQLDKFFPCSEPMYATLSNDSLIPIPDYAEYQDQAQELDELTNRIGLMQKAIKAAGVYDSSQPALKRLLTEGIENELIPVDSWAAMAEKGGLKNSVELLPMLEIAQTLVALYETREKVLSDLYQITGLSDLIRGDTKASETATAQQIKSNFINLRLSEKQREMQRLARNTIEIMGNIIARHFSLDTIKRVSGLQLFTEAEKRQIQAQQAAQARTQSLPSIGGHSTPASPGASGPLPMPSAALAAPQLPGSQQQAPAGPQESLALPPEIQERLSQPSWEQVYALLQDNPDRCFRISIETDSTVQADEQQQQQEATQFVEAIGGFLQQAQEAAGNPDVALFVGEMLSWACRRFPISRDLQGAIDTLTEKLAKAAANPPAPKPDPEMAKVQQQGQIAQAQMQQDQQRSQAEMQLEAMKAHMADQAEQAKAQREQQMAVFQAHIDAANERAKQQADMAAQQQSMMMQAQMDKFKALLEAQTKIEVAEIAADASLSVAQEAAAKQGAGE